MRKTIYICYLLIFFIIKIYGQSNWQPIGQGADNAVRCLYNDTTNNLLYIGGQFFTNINGKTVAGIASWDGNLIDSLDGGLYKLGAGPGISGSIWVMEKYRGKLYASGEFNRTISANIPVCGFAAWDATKWDSLPIQPFSSSTSGRITSMAVIDGELYTGGGYSILNGYPCNGFAKWNDTIWTCLNFPLMPSTPFINAICKYNNEIYVAGNFESSLDITLKEIVRFDGNQWRDVGGGLKGSICAIDKMIVYDNELYVAGIFSKSEGNIGNNIQKWDGISWSDVGGGVTGIGGGIANIGGMIVYDNKLYVTGIFYNAGGVPANGIAYWDGVNWCAPGGLFDNTIGAITSFQDTLYIGGGFWTVDGDTVNRIAKWTGGNYVDTCGNIVSGINEIIKQTNFIIYPNPASSTITIESTNTEVLSIKIFDVLGRDVYNTISTLNKTEIDVSQLPSGIYIVQLQSKKGVVSKKFVKE